MDAVALSRAGINIGNTHHGHTTFGGANSPTYNSWQRMKQRCYYVKHEAFKHYGGRGISVCDRWRNSFENFLADMGPRPSGHTLDRRDVNGNYEPLNCRWLKNEFQNQNRRCCL